MADLREHFKDDDEYTVVKAHLRRRNIEREYSPNHHGFKLTVGWVIFLCMVIGASYLVIKAGHWIIVASIFLFVAIFYLILRIVYRERFRLNKLRKELARRQAKDIAYNEDKSLRHEIDDYKSK